MCIAMNRMLSRTMSTTIAERLMTVQNNIKAAASRQPKALQFAEPRLVAVSKTKGVDMVMDVYDAGQRHFGENYVVELHEKANDIELQDHCEEIRWHFIGHLQRNKVSKVLDVPNLFVIETIDSEKLAKAVNDAWGKIDKKEPLKVMVQCNTSREENKSGCGPKDVVQLVKYIKSECSLLNLIGLMTIGIYDFDCSKGPNPDFQCLVSIREEVCKALDIPVQDLELSMGMSTDYEHAIEMGSTNVRVGSVIFGARAAKPSKPGTESSSKENEGNTKSTDGAVKDIGQQMKDMPIH